MPQRGMCYVSWSKDTFASKYSDASLEKLSSLGVEYVSITITGYQKRYDSTHIRSTERTPSKKSLIHAINKIHSLGMKVMLKPHLDLISDENGSYSRTDISFVSEVEWQKWFAEYKKFILSYAKIAKDHKVEIFCVGTELSSTTHWNLLWKDIILSVKNVFPGKTIYAANWDNFTYIDFWQYLDYAGIDAYFPLTHKESPSITDIKKGWEKWVEKISVWQDKVNKPVIFTEIGYPSASHAAYTPWKQALQGNPDLTIQTKCYKAFFETVWNEPWLAGVYWWKWNTNTRSGGKHNRHFTPQNKPAQKIIEVNYKNCKRKILKDYRY